MPKGKKPGPSAKMPEMYEQMRGLGVSKEKATKAAARKGRGSSRKR